jgi:hypothetical protein
MPCSSHAGSCGRKQSPAKGRSRSLRWTQGHLAGRAVARLARRRRATRRAEPGRASANWPPARGVSSTGILGRDRLPCRGFPYPTRRCGGGGPQELEPPIAPVQSFSRLFKVVQSLKSVRLKSVQTFQISLRRRLRSTAFGRISSNNLERGYAMRLCPDDALTGAADELWPPASAR